MSRGNPDILFEAPRDMDPDEFKALLTACIDGYCAGVEAGVFPRSRSVEAAMGIDDPAAYSAAVDRVKQVVFGAEASEREVSEFRTIINPDLPESSV